MPTQFIRQTAIPCTLSDVASGSWVQNAGLVPSGVRTEHGMISRANIIGVIVEKQDNGFSLEDGTGTVQVRSFDTKPLYAGVGDVVLVIGKPREYNGERFLSLEICKKIRNPVWVSYRKKEIELLHKNNAAPVESPINEPVASRRVDVPEEEIAAQKEPSPIQAILQKIRALDAGPGADVEEVISAIPQSQGYLKTLLEEGEIFEIRPGRVKVLE